MSIVLHVPSVLRQMPRAGFSLSRALFIKNLWAPHLGWQTLFFLEKLATFFIITICQMSVLQCRPYLFSPEKLTTFLVVTVAFIHFLLFTRVLPIISGMLLCCKKFAVSLVGAPVRPNMLNMPKSATADASREL